MWSKGISKHISAVSSSLEFWLQILRLLRKLSSNILHKQCNVIQALSMIGPRASSLPSHNGHPMAVDQNAKHCLRLYSGFDEQNAFIAK